MLHNEQFWKIGIVIKMTKFTAGIPGRVFITNNIGNNETLVIHGLSGLVLKCQLRMKSEKLKRRISKTQFLNFIDLHDASRYVLLKVTILIKLATNRLFFNKSIRIQDGCQCYSTISAIKRCDIVKWSTIWKQLVLSKMPQQTFQILCGSLR